jgi:hypothetical protein
MKLILECYSGRKADERPIRFWLGGMLLRNSIVNTGPLLRPATDEGYSRSPLVGRSRNGFDHQSVKRCVTSLLSDAADPRKLAGATGLEPATFPYLLLRDAQFVETLQD